MGKNIFFKVICILIFSIVNCSCNTKEKTQTNKTLNAGTELPHIEIRPPGKNLPQLKLSEIADNVEYVKLETSKKVLLNFGHAYFSNKGNYIFVTSMGNLYQFDRSGKFIRQISSQGQGPNEFTLHQLSVDFDNQILYVYSRTNFNVLRFDFEGNPLGAIKKMNWWATLL